jgi:hypothetical protein
MESLVTNKITNGGIRGIEGNLNKIKRREQIMRDKCKNLLNELMF